MFLWGTVWKTWNYCPVHPHQRLMGSLPHPPSSIVRCLSSVTLVPQFSSQFWPLKVTISLSSPIIAWYHRQLLPGQVHSWHQDPSLSLLVLQFLVGTCAGLAPASHASQLLATVLNPSATIWLKTLCAAGLVMLTTHSGSLGFHLLIPVSSSLSLVLPLYPSDTGQEVVFLGPGQLVHLHPVWTWSPLHSI